MTRHEPDVPAIVERAVRLALHPTVVERGSRLADEPIVLADRDPVDGSEPLDEQRRRNV